jgi:hypoxanthine phosphoribosyltransferase
MIIRSLILTSCLLKAALLPAESMDSHLKPLIPKEAISEKLRETARQIQSDYKDKDLVVIMVMKGALCVAADLIRELDLPLDVQFVQCSSYGARGTQRGELSVFGLERLNIHNRDVLIVDDIFDSGHTMGALMEALKQKQPRSIKSLVLLSKNVPHVSDYRPEYVLFDIENLFVVGYGLDFKERYRGLTGVYVYSPN